MKLEERAVDLIHHVAKSHLKEGDVVVDATLGNGRDAAFFAETMKRGKIYGFDIQTEALEKSRENFPQHSLVEFIPMEESHENMKEWVREPVNFMVFNLGYLPGGDKTVTTMVHSTIAAVEAGKDLLAPEGILAIASYVGHREGLAEYVALRVWAKSLDQREFTVQSIVFDNQVNTPPRIFLIQRRMP